AQLFQLDASERCVGGVSNRQATAERSEQLLHGIGGGIGSPQHLRLIGITPREIADAKLVAEAVLPNDFGFPERVPLSGLLKLVAQCGDLGRVDAIDNGRYAHNLSSNY